VAEPSDVPVGELDRMSYEQLLEKLEDLTSRMASGEVGIEEAAELYEKAGEVYRSAAERLASVEQRINRLKQPPQPASGDGSSATSAT
jgi:exodeoxyribonuclease VII small subunit